MTNWILTPVRNGIHLTRAAVNTFLKQDIGITRVFLIDNATTDGTAEWSRSMWPRVVTIRKEHPLSVAASWNKGLTLLFSNPEVNCILVVNNDTELRPDTYRRLLEYGGPFVTAVGVSDHKQLENIDPRGVRPHPDFSCYLIRREVWEKVGAFDEKFEGAYGEDADYHLRMQLAGIRAECIGLPFYHVACGTIKCAPTDQAAQMSAQADANRAYFRTKWGVEIGSKEYYDRFGNTAP